MENFDVGDLSDEELKQMLVKNGYVDKHGKEPGPIVKSTRSVYEKQLVKLLQERHRQPVSPPPSAPVQNRTTPRKDDKFDEYIDLNEKRAPAISNAANFSPLKPSAPKQQPPMSSVIPKQQPAASSFTSTTNFSTTSSKIPTSLFSLPSEKVGYKEIVIDNDRMEGEEGFRYVPQKPFKTSPPTSNLFDDDRNERTEVRQRFPETGSGSGSTPLYQKPVHLPGHSLRPWVSHQSEESYAPISYPTLSAPRPTASSGTTASLFDRPSSLSRDVFAKKADYGGDQKQKSSTNFSLYAKIAMAIVFGIFFYMFCRRLFSGVQEEDPKPIE